MLTRGRTPEGKTRLTLLDDGVEVATIIVHQPGREDLLAAYLLEWLAKRAEGSTGLRLHREEGVASAPRRRSTSPA